MTEMAYVYQQGWYKPYVCVFVCLMHLYVCICMPTLDMMLADHYLMCTWIPQPKKICQPFFSKILKQ